MRIIALSTIVIAASLAACSKQEPTVPEEPAAEQAAAVEEAVAETPEINQAIVNHMHKHAEQLDDLMFALADGDLEGAGTPAYWLSRHDTVEGLPEDLQIFVVTMREAAFAVEEATDLEAARAAAEDLSAQCQACHDAAGVTAL